jgi:hypothetical protein
MSHWRLGPLTAVVAMLVSCSARPKAADRATLEASATAHILAIPPPRPEKYRGMIDMKGWRNPYLVIRQDGVGLLDVANSEQRLMKPEDLIQALAQLPASAWPYGRVVAVTQNGLTSPGGDVLIRKNRALVAGTLESMHVLINWVPSA